MVKYLTTTNKQTNIAFQQLQQSTKHCFADFNYPINDVAKNILNDADDLHTIIEQLHKQNQKNSEANYLFDPKRLLK